MALPCPDRIYDFMDFAWGLVRRGDDRPPQAKLVPKESPVSKRPEPGVLGLRIAV